MNLSCSCCCYCCFCCSLLSSSFPFWLPFFSAVHIISIWIRKNKTQTKSIRRKRVDHNTVFRLQNGQKEPPFYIHSFDCQCACYLAALCPFIFINILLKHASTWKIVMFFSACLSLASFRTHVVFSYIWRSFDSIILYIFLQVVYFIFCLQVQSGEFIICIYLECGRTAPWYKKKAAVQRQQRMLPSFRSNIILWI